MVRARDTHAKPREHLGHDLDIGDVGHVGDARDSGCEDGCCHEFERGVLRAFYTDGSGEIPASANND